MSGKQENNPHRETFPFFSLSNQKQHGWGFDGPAAQKPTLPPPPSVEVLLSDSQALFSVKPTMEPINLIGDLSLYKGRVSTCDVFGVSNSDLVPGKYEGGLKLWEGSLDLVKTLHSEIQDGQLCLTGKRVLELGCGHGLPGIVTCLQICCPFTANQTSTNAVKCRLPTTYCCLFTAAVAGCCCFISWLPQQS